MQAKKEHDDNEIQREKLIVQETIALQQSILIRRMDDGRIRYQINAKKAEVLGEGGFAKVKYARHYLKDDPDNKQMKIQSKQQVVKVIEIRRTKEKKAQESLEDWAKRKSQTVARVENEARITKLFHPDTEDFTIKSYPGGDRAKFYLYMPYLGQSLDKVMPEINQLESIQKYQIIKKTFEALYEIHQEEIIHLDIKPHNIFLDYKKDEPIENAKVNIGDFGCARKSDDPHEQMGTIMYMAPEAIKTQGKATATTKTDIYSASAVVAEILGADSKKLLPTVPEAKYEGKAIFNFDEIPDLGNDDKPIRELLAEMCDDDPEKRPCADKCALVFSELVFKHCPSNT